MKRIFARKTLPHRQIESYSVVHVGEQKFFFNEAGTNVLNFVDGQRDEQEIASAVARQLNASEGTAERNLANTKAFLEELYRRGILWLVEDGYFKGISAGQPAPPKATPRPTGDSDASSPVSERTPKPVQEVCMTPQFDKEKPRSIEEQISKLYWDKNYIQKMHLELTYRCNFRCVHCYNTTHSGSDTELTTGEWFRALDQMAEMGCYLLTFTGGEVFVRKDVVEILQYACEKTFSFRLNTNGSLIDEKMLQKFEPMRPFLQSFDISFYGADPTVHDTLARRPGSYNNTLRAVRLLSEAGMNLIAKFITMRDNFDGIQKFEEDMQRLGVRYAVSTGALIPQTNRDTKPLVQILTDAQYRKLLTARPPKNNSSPGNCKPGHVRGAITPDGHVSPCEWLTDFKYGNLREQSLREVWFSPGFLGFRKVFEEDSECPTCELRPGCDRCPAHSYLETGNLLHCAPLQRHNAEIFREVVSA
jgi:radical SAM protein with 4Fe4S-binding SPASM domain